MALDQDSLRLHLYYLDPHPGGAPPVLLLHGLGATSHSWALQIPALLEAGFRPIAPDTPGFGNSPFPRSSMSIAEIAAEISELVQRLNVVPAHVVGISMGGTIALQFALDNPNFVRKLVLVNTFSRLRPSNFAGWIYFVQRFILVHTLGLPTQAKFVVKRVFPAPEHELYRKTLYDQILQAEPRGYRSAMRALARFNVTNRLKEICSPTLVVTADRDTTVDPSIQLELAKAIPGARHAIIPGAGHAVTAEKYEQFNQIMLDFLAGPV